jgi:flavin reductase (DIM6/NTAB) family NADH-FMN oxidoreductase RutF
VYDERVRAALDKMTYGVYVVTARKREQVEALTASWVCQVSREPALMMVGVRKGRRSHDIISKGGVFAVNILADDQAEVARRYASADKLDPNDFAERDTGAPILKDAIAYLDCEVISRLEAGDHTLFVARIDTGKVLRDGQPLDSRALGETYQGEL